MDQRKEDIITMNEKERISYIKALIYIALADDSVEKGEEQYLDQIGALYGLAPEQMKEIKDSVISKSETIESIIENIERREVKLTLLYDLLALCYADDNYSIVEKQGMENICNIMQIEEEKLREMENVMLEQIELQKKVNRILER